MSYQDVKVDDDEYDGRTFTHEDNAENVGHYVGVDPIYQNYANEGEKPYGFTREELEDGMRKAGLDPEEEDRIIAEQEDGSDDESDGDSDDVKKSTKSTPSTPATSPDAPAPAAPPAPAPTKKATTSPKVESK